MNIFFFESSHLFSYIKEQLNNKQHGVYSRDCLLTGQWLKPEYENGIKSDFVYNMLLFIY